MDRNCPNCGAAYDTNVCKCPYCGTSYFDMAAIDITCGKPFYLKLKVPSPYGDGFQVITQLCRINPDISMEINYDYTYCTSGIENKLMRTCSNRNVVTHVTFESVIQQGTNNIIEVTI